MASTTLVREWWADYWAAGYDLRVTLLNREQVKATDFTLPAWRALEHALQTNGYGDASIVSTYYPRPIAGYDCDMDNGGSGCSLHGYSGCAIDIDPADNPFIRDTVWDFDLCRFTREQVEAVLAIRTTSGASVWRWGGDFGDYMHWQLNCSPDDLATGIENDMTITDLIDDATWAQWYEDGHITGRADVMPDYYFADGPASDEERLNAFNVAQRSVSKSKTVTIDVETVEVVKTVRLIDNV